MTAAEEIYLRQARCQPHLLRLRAVAASAGTRVGSQAPAEIMQAAEAVLAEVTAAGRAWPGTAGVAGGPDAAPFLGVRLARLTAAADDAVAAAREGNAAALRSHVRRFETLTSAVWTVQHVLHGAVPSRQAPASSAPGAGTPAAPPEAAAESRFLLRPDPDGRSTPPRRDGLRVVPAGAQARTAELQLPRHGSLSG